MVPLPEDLFAPGSPPESFVNDWKAVITAIKQFPRPVPEPIEAEHQDLFSTVEDGITDGQTLIERWQILTVDEQKAVYQIIDLLAKARVR